MTQFVPEDSEIIAKAMMEQTISFKEGVSAMFELLSTNQKEAIIDYLLDTAIIRDGFGDFVSFAQEKQISLYIVSSGVDFFS